MEFQQKVTRDAADLFRGNSSEYPSRRRHYGFDMSHLSSRKRDRASRSSEYGVFRRIAAAAGSIINSSKRPLGLRKNRPDHRLPAKARLRSAAARFLPEEFLRRKKLGFTPPLREWYGSVVDRYGSTLDNGYLVQAGILQPATARELAAGERRGQDDLAFTFKALVLEMWCQIYSCLGSSHSERNEWSHRKVSVPSPVESRVAER